MGMDVCWENPPLIVLIGGCIIISAVLLQFLFEKKK